MKIFSIKAALPYIQIISGLRSILVLINLITCVTLHRSSGNVSHFSRMSGDQIIIWFNQNVRYTYQHPEAGGVGPFIWGWESWRSNKNGPFEGADKFS